MDFVNATSCAQDGKAPIGVRPDGVSYEWRTVEVDGRSRRYLLAEPSERPDSALAPVIVDVHGSGFDAVGHLATTGSDRACRRGGIVLLPEAVTPFHLRPELPGGYAWNIPGAPLVGEEAVRADVPDDVKFVAAMLDDVSSARRVDPARVHAMGFSGGARLCCYLARDLPGRLASIGAVGGLRFPPGLDSTSVAVIAVHGRADDINPYLGGAGPRWDVSVESAAEAWATAADARSMTQRPVRPGVREHRWRAAGTEIDTDTDTDRVRLVTLAQAGHLWPGSTYIEHRREFGVCDDIDATAVLLDFLVVSPVIPSGVDPGVAGVLRSPAP